MDTYVIEVINYICI